MRQGNSSGRGRGKQDDRRKPNTRKANSNRPKKKGSQNVENERKFYKPGLKQAENVLSTKDSKEGVRLNKFIAATGLCSRREADVHIASGMVAINGKVVSQGNSESNFKISLDKYSSGNYFLNLKTNTNITQSFKIQKIQ